MRRLQLSEGESSVISQLTISQVDFARLVLYVNTLVRNISTYLDSMPGNILTNQLIKLTAASVDALLASYILGLQVIGLSTVAFLESAKAQGISSNGISVLLVKSE